MDKTNSDNSEEVLYEALQTQIQSPQFCKFSYVQSFGEKGLSRCARCYVRTGRLYSHYVEDEETGEKIEKKVCWDCDFDLINGGEYHVDVGEILMEREEEDYEYDPIYYPKPSWYP